MERGSEEVRRGGGGKGGGPAESGPLSGEAKNPLTPRAARKAGGGEASLPAAVPTAGGTHAAVQATGGEKEGEGTAHDSNEDAQRQRAGVKQ